MDKNRFSDEFRSAEINLEKLSATKREQRLVAASLPEVILTLPSQISYSTILDEILHQIQQLAQQGKGVDLGLATVLEITQQCRGYIDVDSEVNKGTTSKTYPHTKDAASPEIQRKQPNALPRGTETILVVEDETIIRELAGYILRRQGYVVLEAANGKEALEMTQNHQGQIHLLLTDTIMPKMGGQALIDQFKLMYPTTKIIVTSGYEDKVLAKKNSSGSDVAFIPKPFSATELVQKVRDILDNN